MTYYNSGYANLLTPLFPECWRSLAGCWRTGRGAPVLLVSFMLIGVSLKQCG
ncbi:MAG: hypothetical protein U0I89_06050 [Prevotella sp.]|nr:hypothetical protein [Prevotella sp.]